MTSKPSRSVLSMKESKAVLSEASSLGKSYSEYELSPRPIWFKGSRDRGLREDIAA